MRPNNGFDFSTTSDACMTCVLVFAGGIVWGPLEVAISPASWQPHGIHITVESILGSVDKEGRRLKPMYYGNHWNRFSCRIDISPIINWTLLLSKIRALISNDSYLFTIEQKYESRKWIK